METGPRSLDAAIEHFTAALGAGDPLAAIEALARRRGDDGIGLADSLDDLAMVHRIVRGEEPPVQMLRRFAIVWSEAAHGTFLARGALDHRTGLATTDYLATRLRDLARTGEHARRRLVVARGPEPSVSRFPAMLRGARVARELVASFPQGETPVGLSGGRIAVIAPEDEAFEANLVRARIAIGAINAVAAELDTIELPAAADRVGDFVSEL